jgi:signal transduction histidine kinase
VSLRNAGPVDRTDGAAARHGPGPVAALTRSTLLVDGLPVLVVLACAAAQLAHRTGSARAPLALAVVLSLLLAAPLAWRRRYPVATFAVVAAVAFTQWALDVRLVADVALLVAVYTVASRRPARLGWAAAGVLELGALLAVVRWDAQRTRLETAVLLTGTVAAALFAGLAEHGRRAALDAALERGRQLERERQQQATIDAASDRARIAREMHDVVAHALSIMVTLTEGAIAKHPVAPDQAVAAMRQVSSTGREALGDMRGLLGVLRADGGASDRRPQPAVLTDLDALLDQVRSTGLAVESTVHGSAPDPIGPGVQLTVYRIVQEALTNVLRHADRPSLVRVDLAYRPDRIDVEIENDGARTGRVGAGHGIAGMAERAGASGGWADAGPGSDGVWRVVASVPTTGGPP